MITLPQIPYPQCARNVADDKIEDYPPSRLIGTQKMQFTVLSHAGLLVEHAGKRLVCDPWLVGSCYWRSWWNYPEPPQVVLDELRADFIYLTHLHWDHFHGPSLQKYFDPKTRIFVPKVPTHRMVDDLRWLGFHDIVEVPHGGRVLLGDDFEMRSYQFGIAVDSAVVLASSKITIFNCNDAKFFGQPLRQIMRDWPTIDFILRSHSSAGPLPYCVENWQEILSGIEAREYDSADQFARCAQYVGARYAIPFASNHCFLHPETTRFNGTATTPEAAQERFAQLAAESGYQGECVVMPPGSRWSEEGGFALSTFDFSRRKQYIEQLGAKYRDQLAETQRLEDETLADFGTFRDYFEGLLRALPPFVGRRWLLPVAFRTTDRHGTRDWIVDPKSGTVTEDIQAPRSHVVFEVHPRVLNDCTAKRMFSVWSASKRLKIHLPEASHLRATSLWLMVLDLYEVDTLPLWRNFTLRSVAVRLRRWREVVEAGRIVLRRLVFRKPFSVAEIYIR